MLSPPAAGSDARRWPTAVSSRSRLPPLKKSVLPETLSPFNGNLHLPTQNNLEGPLLFSVPGLLFYITTWLLLSFHSDLSSDVTSYERLFLISFPKVAHIHPFPQPHPHGSLCPYTDFISFITLTTIWYYLDIYLLLSLLPISLLNINCDVLDFSCFVHCFISTT